MPEQVLVDNDVVLKASCYDLCAETVAAAGVGDRAPAILGVARFVVRGRLGRSKAVSDRARALDSLERMLAMMTLVEPDAAELAAAADLEAEAARHDLELDGGESQLLAILANRGGRALVTGDKRAIRAMSVVAKTQAAGRIVCLEQLMSRVVGAAGLAAVGPRVCAEPLVDRAMTICFGCSSGGAGHEDVQAALASYVAHLEAEAPGVLVPDGGVAAGAA